MSRWFIILVASVSLVGPLLAQSPTPVDAQKAAEKLEKQASIIDQVTTDAAGLMLGENRSYVFAKLGALLWKRDPKAASSMFQKAVSEFVNAQSQAEADSKGSSNGNQNEIRLGQNVRPNILLMIAACDAAFALESLYRTRGAAILRAMAQNSQPTLKVSDLSGAAASIVRSELNLEQRISRLAAEQNPELAAKMMQESIKKGLSNETLSMLKKLFEKDPETANSLASDVVDKLSAASFSNDPADSDYISLTTAILTDFIRDKKPGAKELKFDEAPIRSLAVKLIDFTLAQDARYSYQRFTAAINIAQKLAPNSVAALKKVQKSGLPVGVRSAGDPDVRKILDSRATPAQMLSDAKTLPPDDRPLVYQNAANRMAQGGNLGGATDILNSNFSGTALENALNAANASYAAYLIGQGKFAEAEKLIDEFPDATRRTSLLGLATSAYRKDPVENKTFAVTILRKVRSMMPSRPGDPNELAQFMQLTSAYAGIDPDEAFNCVEPLSPMLNELADANAVVQGFQNNFLVRSGEFVMATGAAFGFQFDQSVLRVLAKTDFDRTMKLIDSFSRREMRIGLRLQLAETGLN